MPAAHGLSHQEVFCSCHSTVHVQLISVAPNTSTDGLYYNSSRTTCRYQQGHLSTERLHLAIMGVRAQQQLAPNMFDHFCVGFSLPGAR